MSTMALVELIFHDHTVEYTDAAAGDATDIRFDYHRVVGELRVTEKLPVDTRAAIKEWIAGGQIKFGALVFKRGTKAWFNRLLPVGLFADDSLDHITTTQELCDPWLRTLLVDSPETLRVALRDYHRCDSESKNA